MTQLMVTAGLVVGLCVVGGIAWTAFRQRRHSKRRILP